MRLRPVTFSSLVLCVFLVIGLPARSFAQQTSGRPSQAEPGLAFQDALPQTAYNAPEIAKTFSSELQRLWDE
jgi:hypothetical protein